jgi:hypothetical protein
VGVRSIAVAAGAVVATAFPTHGATPATASWLLVAGPALAGNGVVWVESDGAKDVVRYAAPGSSPAVIQRFAVAGFDDVAGSRSQVLLGRSTQSCLQGYACVAGEEALAGPPTGPLVSVVRRRTCSAQAAQLPVVDVSGAVGAYAGARCQPPRAVLLRLNRRPRPIGFAPYRSVSRRTGARVAGHFVALAKPWSRGVDVYDLRNGKLAYAVLVEPNKAIAFDVDEEGAIAVAREGRLFRASPARPRLRSVAAPLPVSAVRIGAGRIAFSATGSAGESVLGVADKGDRIRVVARVSDDRSVIRAFDFDGDRLTWATDRISIRESVCPPRSNPCFTSETGKTEIRLLHLGTGRLRLIADLPFTDRER